MSAFSSSDKEVLERKNEIDGSEFPLFSQIWNEKHKSVSSSWIRDNCYKRVCLQFPDEYLSYSNAIRDSLKSIIDIDVKIFILADTTYGSCCVDDIAAAHVGADSVIHFGNACRNYSRQSVLYLYPHMPICLEQMLLQLGTLQSTFENKELCFYVDIGYQELLKQKDDDSSGATLHRKLCNVLRPKALNIKVYPPQEDSNSIYDSELDRICIFVGKDNSRFANLSLSTKANCWYIYDPVKNELCEKNPLTSNFIRRRYYYIEKCKDAQTLGLIVATLSAPGYLEAVTRLQDLAKNNGIKTQIISVGRINPAKLANFLEIDCFVLIGCLFNNMYTSKDYYKPIVSVFEAEMALNPAWLSRYPETYITDFKELLNNEIVKFDPSMIESHDVSLINGHLRGSVKTSTKSTALAPQPKMDLMNTTTGLVFEDRSWQGLNPTLGQNEPSKIIKGLKGIPIKYIYD